MKNSECMTAYCGISNLFERTDTLNSPAENKFDLELSSKVFFFTESRSVDIAFEESE